MGVTFVFYFLFFFLISDPTRWRQSVTRGMVGPALPDYHYRTTLLDDPDVNYGGFFGSFAVCSTRTLKGFDDDRQGCNQIFSDIIILFIIESLYVWQIGLLTVQ